MRQVADRLNADGYTPTAEDQSNWEAVNRDYNATLAAIDREEAAAAAESRVVTANPQNRIGGGFPQGDPRARGGDGAELATDRTRALAMAAWCRAQMDGDLTAEQEEACRVMRMNPHRAALTFNLLSDRAQYAELQNRMATVGGSVSARGGMDYFATLSNQSGPGGAYLIPPLTLIRNLEVNMLAYGGLLQAADTITTTTGERMAWPTADDTTNKGVRLGSNKAVAPSSGGLGQGVDPNFSQVFWDAYKYTSQPVLVPYELIEDSQAADIPALLGELLGIRLGRILNDECTTGTGNSMPKGIVTAAGSGYTTSKAGKISADDLMNLEHTVDPAYRSLPGVGYMFHDKILLQVRLLKDGDGQYLYRSGANYAAPDTINGRRFWINQSMASVTTTGTTVMLFGNIPAYKVRRVNGIRMYRLEERYRDTDQDGFIALLRADGNLLTAGTNPVQKLVTS